MEGSTDRYTLPMVKRITNVAMASAVGITLMMLVEVWGDWRSVACGLAVLVTLIAFNTWVTLVLHPRRGTRFAETLRSCVNLSGVVLAAAVIGMPVTMWLWIPFAALTFDNGAPRLAAAILAVFALALAAIALSQDVAPIYPAMFSLLGFACMLISRARLATIRDMLDGGDAQRLELEAAHAGVAAAHDRLVEESRAREQVELELRQAQKLEAIGRLAAGIAHEINTPVQFVNDSVHFVDDATRDLLALATFTQARLDELRAGAPAAEVLAMLAEAEAAADLPYVVEHLPRAVARMLDGLDRIAKIVRSMKEFAHPDLKDVVAADLNRALAATIAISAHEHKNVAEIDFVPGELPPVTCRPGEINQVFLNLLVNAAHSIGDVVGEPGARGRIEIRTWVEADHVVIAIADTGAGIADSIRDRVFDPFFTTKPVGRGTGQGLAISRNVVRAHGGTLTFESQVGRGTTFTVRLPVAPADDPLATTMRVEPLTLPEPQARAAGQ